MNWITGFLSLETGKDLGAAAAESANFRNSPSIVMFDQVMPDGFDIRDLTMEGTISAKSSNFLAIANLLMKTLDKTPFADYSAVSLQYFKIIELTIKERVILKALEELDEGKVSEGISKIVNAKLSNLTDNLSLGGLHRLFLSLLHADAWREIDEESLLFRDNLRKLLIDNGQLLYLLEVTHSSVISKYRNPAAHTNPLSRAEAIEAREIMKTLVFYICEFGEPYPDVIGPECLTAVIGDERQAKLLQNIKKYYKPICPSPRKSSF